MDFSAVRSDTFVSRPETIRLPSGLTARGVSLFAGTPTTQAIRFTAEVNIRPGHNITIQFIQNLVKYDGVLTNSSPPHNPLRFFKPGCDGTLLDMFQQATPQPSAYLPYYRSTPSPSGTRLTIRAHDAPKLSGITVDHPDGTSTMQIDATYGYEMYLGCTIGDRKETFQTLGMLAWGVRFAGNLVYSPPWPVDPPERHLLSNNWAGAAYRFDLDESTAKIWAANSVRSVTLPKMNPPTFNFCAQKDLPPPPTP